MKRFAFILLFWAIAMPLYSQSAQSLSKLLPESSNLGSINVTIGGNFVMNGSFSVFGAERFDQFITRLYENYKAERLKATNGKTTFIENNITDLDIALRDITLKHSNGSVEKIDLAKFRITGDMKYNPYLRLDDFIYFPKLELNRNFFAIDGAVYAPGKFQFVDGDKLQDAILLAQGFDKSFDKIDNIVISRLSADGDTETLIKCSPDDNPELKRGDRIEVVASEVYRKDFKVTINGEVNNPGRIYITKGKTTLREVIQKAGGFTSKADLSKAELLRGGNVFKSNFFSEEFEKLMMSRMAEIAPDDSITFFVDNRLRFARANGVIDFSRINSDTASSGGFLVQDGDYISVPEKIDLVYVFGHVYNPGYLKFEQGKSYTYYIEKVGGIGQNPKGEIYLIKGKTRSWIKIDEKNPPVIEAGDYIWVPKQPTRTFDYYLTRVTAVAGVVAAVATTILLIVQLNK